MSSLPNEASAHHEDIEALRATRDQALREQGRLQHQLEDALQRLQVAEAQQQHQRLGWLWMALLLLFGLSGYWRGYMAPATLPQQPHLSKTEEAPSALTGALSPLSSLPPPLPSQAAPHHAKEAIPPQATKESNTHQTMRKPPPKFRGMEGRPPEDREEKRCAEGSSYRCIFPCLRRDAQRRCVEQAKVQRCQCWRLPQAPSFKILSLQVEGEIRKERLEKAFRLRSYGLRRCLQPLLLPTRPSLQGEVTLAFQISSRGRLGSAEVKASSFAEALRETLHPCFLRELQKLRFATTPTMRETSATIQLRLRAALSRSQVLLSPRLRESAPPARRVNGALVTSAADCPPNTRFHCTRDCMQHDERGRCLQFYGRPKCQCLPPEAPKK
jgi:hypothetical protein